MHASLDAVEEAATPEEKENSSASVFQIASTPSQKRRRVGSKKEERAKDVGDPGIEPGFLRIVCDILKNNHNEAS